MMQRRSALQRLAIALLGSAWALVSCAPWRRPGETGAAARRLERELVLLAHRTNSEQGIPMFLVCENLAGSARPAIAAEDLRESRQLAEHLRTQVAARLELRPTPVVEDVQKLVELLAERDFGVNLPGRRA